MQALSQPQPAPNPPLSTDPDVEARGGGSRTPAHTDVPNRTMTSATAGRGAGPRAAVEQAAPGTMTGTYDTGATPDVQNIPPGWTEAAGTLKNNQPAVPWNVQIGRGVGPNEQLENVQFQKGQAPQITEQGTPEQQRVQQESLQTEQAKHPNPTASRDRATDERMLANLHKMATELSAPYAKPFAPPMPPEVKDRIDKFNTQADTLMNSLVSGTGYQAGQSIQGPAGQGATTQPTANRGALTDPQVAQQYLQQAGGDPAKARQLAQQDGWSL